MWLPAEKKPRLKKAELKQRIGTLQEGLLRHQRELRDADFPVILVFGGVDGAGKHETVNLLNEWLDPRYLQTLAYDKPTQEALERPPLWRYWRDLPIRGRIGLVLSGWYSRPLLKRVKRRSSKEHFLAQLERIRRFERLLADDGALILKFWMHLDHVDQAARLQTLIRDPQTVWQVKPQDWEHLQLYERFNSASELLLDSTHADHAPWEIVDGSDERRRSLVVVERLAEALTRRLKNCDRPQPDHAYTPSTSGRLAAVDLTQSLDKDEYRKALKKAQSRLHLSHRTALDAGRATVLVFEGWDAAGKGGAIRRIVRVLDARQYRVIPIAAPSDEELARPYLWRFWRALPRAGHLTIFDRSWYGRVLVERVEGYASPLQWQRAYREINEFEAELTQAGIRILKFWLQISPEEQLQRFQNRKDSPLKSWKLTPEDWRNREKWDDYSQAVEDMLALTDTPDAPWVVVPANDKRYARVMMIREVCRRLAAP